MSAHTPCKCAVGGVTRRQWENDSSEPCLQKSPAFCRVTYSVWMCVSVGRRPVFTFSAVAVRTGFLLAVRPLSYDCHRNHFVSCLCCKARVNYSRALGHGNTDVTLKKFQEFLKYSMIQFGPIFRHNFLDGTVSSVMPYEFGLRSRSASPDTHTV